MSVDPSLADRWLMHNSRVDLAALGWFDLPDGPPAVDDTMLLAALLGEDRIGLKILDQRYHGGMIPDRIGEMLKELEEERAWAYYLDRFVEEVAAVVAARAGQKVRRADTKRIASLITVLTAESIVVALTRRHRLVDDLGSPPDVDVSDIPWNRLRPYSAADAAITMREYRRQQTLPGWDAAISVYRLLEEPLFPVLHEMEQTGILIDVEALGEADTRFVEKLDKLYSCLPSSGGMWLDPLNPTDLRELLYDVHNLPVYAYTKETRQPSTSRSTLERLALDHPWVRDIVEMKHLDKLRNTYTQKLPSSLGSDGRLHGRFNQLKADRLDDGSGQQATETGRLSSSDPNLQNIPARDEDGKLIRKAFIASPGKQWFKADYCIHPSSRVLTADMDWVYATDLVKGQEIVGFDEYGGPNKRRRYRRTTVTSLKKVVRPTYRVTTTRGEIISSAEHRWLRRVAAGYTWRETEKLAVGDFIAFYGDMWDKDCTPEGQYLAGFFDGEGWVSGRRIGFGQNDGVVRRYVVDLLRQKGFTVHEKKAPNRDIWYHALNGRAVPMRFYGMFKPKRLRPNWDGMALGGRNSAPAQVTKIEYLGVKELIAIETGTKTLLVNGHLSHNSSIELRIISSLAGDPILQETFRQNRDPHVESAKAALGSRWDNATVAEQMSYRSIYKNVNYLVNFGGGATRLVQTSRYTITLKEAEEAIERYYDTHPTIRDYQTRMVDAARRQGFSETLLGRRRYHRLLDSGDNISRAAEERASFNHPVQGTAADLMKLALRRSWEMLPRKTLINVVHDELDGETDLTQDTIRRILVEAMVDYPTPILRLDVPIRVEIGFGRSWGDTWAI